MRKSLLTRETWNVVVRLGPGAFETISGEVVNAALVVISAARPTESMTIAGTDVSAATLPSDKAAILRNEIKRSLDIVSQAEQLTNPDARITFKTSDLSSQLNEFGRVYQGIGTSDGPQFIQRFWEGSRPSSDWVFYQMAPDQDVGFSGFHSRLLWCEGCGPLIEICQKDAQFRGKSAWGRRGIALAVTDGVFRGEYVGNHFDCTFGALVLENEDHLPAAYAFTLSKVDPILWTKMGLVSVNGFPMVA